LLDYTIKRFFQALRPIVGSNSYTNQWVIMCVDVYVSL
jgi:hypothetical protein